MNTNKKTKQQERLSQNQSLNEQIVLKQGSYRRRRRRQRDHIFYGKVEVINGLVKILQLKHSFNY